MTIDELIYGFRSLVSERGYLKDATEWSNRLILHHLLKIRSKLIYDKINKNQDINKHVIQRIACLKLEETDRNECPCTPNSGCTFVKTICGVPNFIKIISVTSTAGNISYDPVDWDRFQYIIKSRNRKQRESAYYTIENVSKDGCPRIYLYNDVHKDSVTIRGIAENPLEIAAMKDDCSCEIDPCFDPMSSKIFVDPDLINTMYQMAINSLVQVHRSAPYDKIQDDHPDNTGQILTT